MSTCTSTTAKVYSSFKKMSIAEIEYESQNLSIYSLKCTNNAVLPILLLDRACIALIYVISNVKNKPQFILL